MKRFLILLMGLAGCQSGTANNEKPVAKAAASDGTIWFSKAKMGRKWPLTISDSVKVECEGNGMYYLLTTASGVTYAMNGTAKSRDKWPELEKIISKRDSAGMRYVGDTQPFFEVAYKICKQ
ncbi:DUF2511 domain-containing protein [Hymenobacter sp. BT664]|uniref:DUF2511 domain-containing protein n=1 Tax=Hymenobacter montanus TaxID=2771359 RepID=A0A927GKQ6_9BACT|nr:DUF2511 domain-containing protein [Hymenobacter montanus]MBD2769720.1 DUF2511 domain-containing protein [Hymenobacter montanus]